tara:strand:+ start:134 stop:334 length:201 start_codon:yes stop_codon:yes gene_type:complete
MNIPKQDIKWLVAREHAGESDKFIGDMIAGRTNATWTDAKVLEARLFAIKCHHENKTLFNHIMGRG